MSRVSIATMRSSKTATRRASAPRVAEQRRDLDRRTSLDGLTTRDRERPRLVRPRHPRRPLGDIETSPLRRTKRLVPELRIANPSIPHAKEHLHRNPVHAQPMMRKHPLMIVIR